MDDEFPDSGEFPEKTTLVKWADGPTVMPEVRADIVYQELSGEKQHIQLLIPSQAPDKRDVEPPKYPLIVFIQGSAWLRQNVWEGLDKALAAVEKGFAFALVEYRPSDVAPFPAQIEDAKSAIRFLRLHVDEYGIDTKKVAIWGNSSGGHTAVMVGLTGDGLLDNGQYGDVTCAVDCVVDWYGPTDISLMNYYPSAKDHREPDSPEGLLIGRKNVLDSPEITQKVNPMNYVSADKQIPPFLIMHGSKDEIVPFNQSVRLYDKLRENDKDVTFYKVDGGKHFGPGGFNSSEAKEVSLAFIEKYLK